MNNAPIFPQMIYPIGDLPEGIYIAEVGAQGFQYIRELPGFNHLPPIDSYVSVPEAPDTIPDDRDTIPTPRWGSRQDIDIELSKGETVPWYRRWFQRRRGVA